MNLIGNFRNNNNFNSSIIYNNYYKSLKSNKKSQDLINEYNQCFNKCCFYLLKEYTDPTNIDYKHKYKKQKAGVLFFNERNKKILLVQSRGQKWGIPKG